MENGNNYYKNNNYSRRIKQGLISTTLVGSLLISGSIGFASEVSANTVTQQKVVYKDYTAKQGASEDMLWAVNQGLLSGYMKTTNPANKADKTVANWLNPSGGVTEGQMLTAVFKYTAKQELSTTKSKDAKFSSAVQYQLASKYKIPTKGSLTNKAPAGAITTRGSFAQALATKHFGKQMSMKDSVAFMYSAKLSTGNVVNGKTPMNYDSFGVSQNLSSQNVASMMKKYDAYVQASKQTVKPPTTQVQTPKPPAVSSSSQVVQGIKVQYGKHTYGNKTQAEYDQSMQILTQKVKENQNVSPWSKDGTPQEIVDAYFNGERGIRDRNDPNARTERNMQLVSFEGNYSNLIDNGMTKSQLTEYVALRDIAKILTTQTKDPGNGSPSSTYDALVRKISDCDSDAQVISAIFDMKGYSTAIIAGNGHADALISINGKWVNASSGEVYNVKANLGNGNYMLAQPTDGTILSK